MSIPRLIFSLFESALNASVIPGRRVSENRQGGVVITYQEWPLQHAMISN